MSESRNSLQEYLGKVEVLLRELQEVLHPSELAEVRRLVNHGEPAEGMRTLAWIIHDRKLPASRKVRLEVIDLTGGLVEDVDMPAGFSEAPSDRTA